MNRILKSYLLKAKSVCIGLGYSLAIVPTSVKTIALVCNLDSNKIGLVSYETDIFGESEICFYLINKRKYKWAKDEGFSLDQMFELTKEGIFVKADANKMPQYLL